ncbi:MAG: DUF6498-containing protein [Deltaproteobacteria bacterium]|nr:DUF6498-containing protein [Deltaproteobacteria bacterium]
MKLPKITFSIFSLVVANLIPLAGVFLFGWDAAVIVLLYWAENLVIGFYNILKMTFLKVYSRASILETLFAIPFFCLHYGAFCAVHGYLLLVLFNLGDGASSFVPKETWPGPFVFLQMLASVVTSLWQTHPPGMEWSVVCLFLSHGLSFKQNYLGKKEYTSFTTAKLLIQPYKRIIILHVAVIAGALPIMMCGSPVPLLCILVLLKTGMDIFLHMKEHRIDSP